MTEARPIIYLIRHGEKGAKLPDGKDPDGLDAQGLTRANGLPDVFGSSSEYNISYILAEHPKSDGGRSRPYDTVEPLAKALGIKIYSKIDRDDVQGAADAAKAYGGPGNVLLCWEHGQLAKIATALGVQGYAGSSGWSGPVEYPGDRFDLIWTVNPPYTEISTVTSEGVPGLDQTTTGDVVPKTA